jgi:hypothetical protein
LWFDVQGQNISDVIQAGLISHQIYVSEESRANQTQISDLKHQISSG